MNRIQAPKSLNRNGKIYHPHLKSELAPKHEK